MEELGTLGSHPVDLSSTVYTGWSHVQETTSVITLGVHVCKPYKVNFQQQATDSVTCFCCGYHTRQISCSAKQLWEFEQSYVTIYHYGNHTCVPKKKPLT